MDRSSNIDDDCQFCDKIDGDLYDHCFKKCIILKIVKRTINMSVYTFATNSL